MQYGRIYDNFAYNCPSAVFYRRIATLSSSSTQSVAESQQPVHPASLWPDASLLGVALIWGINIPIMKNGLEQVDVFVFNAIRLVISAIVLTAFAIRERRAGLLPVMRDTSDRWITCRIAIFAAANTSGRRNNWLGFDSPRRE